MLLLLPLLHLLLRLERLKAGDQASAFVDEAELQVLVIPAVLCLPPALRNADSGLGGFG